MSSKNKNKTQNILCIKWRSNYKNLEKSKSEKYFLIWSLIWMFIVFLVVISQIYEQWDSTAYMIFGLIIGIPPFFIPFYQHQNKSFQMIIQTFSFKANIWIFIMSWVANYFWTHYFYSILGASYTFPAYRFNNVPLCLYFMTHSYFLFYHTISTIILRYISSTLFKSIIIVLLGYFLSFMEVWTLENFPYYQQIDIQQMYLIGSAFYTLYFIISFPMYYYLDEYKQWSLSYTIINGLACCMLITQALDLWRLFLGPIYDDDSLNDTNIPFITTN